ncbi:hypothetical protein GCM10009679_42050 [Saccharothrix algeriensis]|uniref:Uncharacterized protein n=2 Tax=Catellatospora bangladeshensis TaxID=310355 RepID=A0A8J3NL30_9ACTN|nr:hypothetical protein Cba03nite_47000 [Catellatospora bangladeshensis]
MINSLLGGFDVYVIRARVYPGLLALVLPVGVMGVALIQLRPALAWVPMAASMGTLFFLSSFTRSLGRRLEPKLVRQWDGLPTTRMLRHRETHNALVFEERRKALEKLTGVALPTKRQESNSPTKADDAYIAAVRKLINRVRDSTTEFPRVFEENIHYGFARNLLALKAIALIVLAFSSMGISILVWRGGATPEAIAALSFYALAAVLWTFFIRPAWVHQVGQTYADRLFDALDVIDAQPPATLPGQRESANDSVGPN